MERDPRLIGDDDAEAVAALFDRLGAEDHESAVLSALYEREDGEVRLRHASLLIGPARLGQVNWARWRIDHAIRLTWDFGEAKSLPPTFVFDGGTFVAGRSVMTPTEARAWLTEGVRKGDLPQSGPLPSATVRPFHRPQALLRVFPRLWTPVARLAAGAIRPMSGFFFETRERPSISLPSDWEIDGRRILGGAMTALGISIPDACFADRAPSAQGLLVGRLERRAWFNDVRGSGDFELYELHLGWEPERCDLAELEVELEEWVGDELAHSRRLALGETELGEREGAEKAIVSLPTLGRGVGHSARMHHRDGSLLDVTNRSKLVEQIDMKLQFSVSGGEPAEQRITAGHLYTPTVDERVERFDSVERQYRELLEAGLAGRIVTDPATAFDVVHRHLKAARGEVRVLDPYFGADAADWALLAAATLPVRVLTGWKAQPASMPLSHVDARKLDKAVQRTPGFHDRLYLWDGGGLSVGTSPSGLGKRDSRVDQLGAVEAAAWTALFETYWTSGKYVPF